MPYEKGTVTKMGRFGTPQLGYMRDDDDNDIPELNKCPACGAFFEGDICPICKAICPEEMRAGNRKPVKKKKKRSRSKGYRVPQVWYLQTWFVVLCLLFSKLIGIILVWMTDRKKWVKVTVTVIALFGSTILNFFVLPFLSNLFYKKPVYVDFSISESAYREKCEDARYEELMRYPEEHRGDYVVCELTVVQTASEFYADEELHGDFLLCRDEAGNEFVVFDCRRDGGGILVGDKIRVYGEFLSCRVISVFSLYAKYPVVCAAYSDRIG